MKGEQVAAKHGRPNYGVDAPGALIGLALGGAACLAMGLAWAQARWMLTPAGSLLGTAAVWYWNSRVGKLRLRERVVDLADLNGAEAVLDVGCGSGLLLVAAARRLTTGTATGVDIWRSQDLSNNRIETTLRNATLEGVADRVRVEEGDARQLPFPDATFDVVVSLNVIHNIPDRREREHALAEIVRVLRPGGRFVLCDFRNVSDYVQALREHGVVNARRKLVGWVLPLPMYAAVGQTR